MPEKKAALIDTPLSNNEIVEIYLNNNLIQDCVEFQFNNLYRNGSQTDRNKLQFKEDLRQDLVVFLLTYDNEKMNNAHFNNHMNALITRILQNQLYSNTSKFYCDYLKFDLRTSEITPWNEPRSE